MHVYLDESGDPGFDLSRSATRHFVIAMLVVESPTVLDDVIEQFRREQGIAPGVELHATSTPPARRAQFLQAIQGWDFAVRALVVDKALVRKQEMNEYSAIYNHFIACLLAEDDLIERATLVLDRKIKKSRSRAEAASRLRHQLGSNGRHKIRSIKYMDS